MNDDEVVPRYKQLPESESKSRLKMRMGLLEPNRADPFAFERIIGQSDLLSINFLDRGRRSADAVCRIKLPMEGGISYGTGFLVGPRLLVTNNHVIANEVEAAQAEAEFGYEHDLDGVVKQPATFNLDPNSIFFTSTELDFTMIAVAPMSSEAVPLERFSWLPLIPVSGKALVDEWVSIIQHPGSRPKQIAIHASRIVKPKPGEVNCNQEHFIHYSTDTEPGSSGSPVFNDQWQVVAIHHKAVPKPGADPAAAARGEKIDWLYNEGTRISAIFKLLERNRFEDNNARRVLDCLTRGLGFPPLVRSTNAVPPESGSERQFAPFKITRWNGDDLGYDANFLTESFTLKEIYAPLLGEGLVAPLASHENEHELRYFHFSSVVHARRHFPLLTAVNIHGARLVHPGKRNDTWRPDARLAQKFQPDDEFYLRTLKPEAVYFSRGHLVRLLDPCWSIAATTKEREAEARRGMEDTFHFTNAAPQFQVYNDVDWGNLEDYVLDRAQTTEKKLTVFTGPIFRLDDPVYGRERKGGPWQIPLSYWKIMVLQKTEDQVAAAAFIVGQTEYVRALYEARVFSGLKPYTLGEIRSRGIQTTVTTVEEQTGLDLKRLKPFDVQGNLEATRQTRWLDRPDDLVI